MTCVAALLVLLSPSSGAWSLKDGSQVSFAFLRTSPVHAWRPDGKPCDAEPFLQDLPNGLAQDTRDLLMVAVIRSAHKRDYLPTIRIRQPEPSGQFSQFTNYAQNKKSWVCGALSSLNQTAIQDISVGIASEPWSAIGSVDFRTSKNGLAVTDQSGVKFNPEISNAIAPRRATFRTPVTSVKMRAIDSLKSIDVRMVVIDQDGHSKISEPSAIAAPGKTQYLFEGDIHRVRRIELQTRPFEWTHIKSAHFQGL